MGITTSGRTGFLLRAGRAGPFFAFSESPVQGESRVGEYDGNNDDISHLNLTPFPKLKLAFVDGMQY